jgi:hypothetical protein
VAWKQLEKSDTRGSAKSKVALIIDDPRSSRTQIAAVLRKHLQINLGHVLQAIDEKRAVLERPLFTREAPLFPEHLLSAFEALDELDVAYAAFQLLDSQTFVGMSRDSLYQLSTGRLRTMIDARKKSLEQIRQQARREDGVE